MSNESAQKFILMLTGPRVWIKFVHLQSPILLQYVEFVVLCAGPAEEPRGEVKVNQTLSWNWMCWCFVFVGFPFSNRAQLILEKKKEFSVLHLQAAIPCSQGFMSPVCPLPWGWLLTFHHAKKVARRRRSRSKGSSSCRSHPLQERCYGGYWR